MELLLLLPLLESLVNEAAADNSLSCSSCTSRRSALRRFVEAAIRAVQRDQIHGAESARPASGDQPCGAADNRRRLHVTAAD